MKKLTFFLTAALFSVSTLLPAQNLQEVLDNYFEVNGQEKLLAAKNSVSTGKMLQMGLEIPFKQYSAAPSKFRVEATFQGMSIITTYNGTEGWNINPFSGQTEPQPMGEVEMKAMAVQADYEGMFWNYEKKGYKVTLEGTEEVEGANCYAVKVVHQNDDTFTYYIDAESYVVLKTSSKMTLDGRTVESETYMSNYQEGDGYVFPGKIETRSGGQIQNTVVIDKMEIGLDLDDSLFEKPTK